MCREEEGRRRVKALQKQLVDVRREKEVELQHRNEMIAHLKDQLQEMKAKTNMEGKYIKKVAEVSVAQSQKKCVLTEKQMRDEIKVGGLPDSLVGSDRSLLLVRGHTTVNLPVVFLCVKDKTKINVPVLVTKI